MRRSVAQGGRVMRPGAELPPVWVWQLLQSPVGTAVVIDRVLPWKVTCAVIGNARLAVPWKFPEVLLTVKLAVAPFRSVTVTIAPPAARPLQSSGSCPVGYTVPPTLKEGPPCWEWQVMQACPGSMSELPWVPPVQVEALVHVGAASSGSGGPASGGGGGTPPSVTHVPPGMPAETQAWKAATSAGATAAFGAGGIGEDADCIRDTDIAPFVCEGFPGEAACSAASVARDCGAPPEGVDP